MTPLGRRVGAEAMGTALLFTAVVGSGIMAERLSDGNFAVALLGNTLATAAMLAVLIAMFAPLSGAHFNPAVTAVALVRREIGRADALLFVAVQLGAGIGAMMLTHAMFDMPIVQAATKERAGVGQFLSECVATFGLILTIIGTARCRASWVPASVALFILSAYWFTASTSFANPAITIARSLTDSFAGIRSDDVAPFIVAQLLGAMAGAGAGWALFDAGEGCCPRASAE